MALISGLLEKLPILSAASKYTVMNGVLYLGTGVLFIAWPAPIAVGRKNRNHPGSAHAYRRPPAIFSATESCRRLKIPVLHISPPCCRASTSVHPQRRHSCS